MDKNFLSNVIPASAYTVKTGDFTVMLLMEDGRFDFYVRQENTPYNFMYGVPMDQQDFTEAFETAIANVPNYMFMFEWE